MEEAVGAGGPLSVGFQKSSHLVRCEVCMPNPKAPIKTL